MISYPQLKQSIKLKKRNDFAVIHGNHPSQLLILQPSEAFVLNFCTGKYSSDEIKYLYKETYNIPETRAIRDIDSILVSKKGILNLNNKAVSDLMYFNNPTDFLYKSNESDQEDVKKNHFLAGINLSLTLKCNFNCKYCYQTLNTSNEKLDLSKCLSLVKEASELGMVHFGLTGGEPTLFKGWLTLIQRIIEHEMIPNITSNGYIIGSVPGVAQKLKSIGLNEMTISLDASKQTLHHFITNTTNTFNYVINAIRYLLENDIRVQVKYVLSSLNVNDLENFIDRVVNLGVQEVGITNIEGGAVNSGANSVLPISKAEYENVLLLINEKAEKYRNKCIIHPPSHNSCLMGKNEWFPCGGLSTGMSIFPNGDVTICDKLFNVKEFTYGNVFTQSISNIWKSDALKNIRNSAIDKNRIDKDCAACSYISQCKTGCFVDSYNTTGDYFSKTPRCQGPFNIDVLSGKKQ